MRLITSQNIEDIYNKFVKCNYTSEYSNRYNPLPYEKNVRNWKWEGKDFPRIPSLLEFERFTEKYNFQIQELLIFNGENDPELEILGNRVQNITNINYEQDPTNNDLHILSLNKTDYDFVCLHQTLEHVTDPQTCILNIFNHLKPGGYLYINVPACNMPHSEPFHFYTGITPMGVATLGYRAGFNILEIGHWGNLEYMNILWNQKWWADYTMMQAPGYNDHNVPIITWGLFQKPTLDK